MQNIFCCLVGAMVALLISLMLNPRLVKLSYNKHLTDKPNHRKTQKRPVPVLGGVSVLLGTIWGTLSLMYCQSIWELHMVIICLVIIFFVGFLDDIIDLHVITKFFFQIGVVLLLWNNGYKIDNLLGLVGVYDLSKCASISLSLLSGVGLMNAMNMIDGVDGLASGFGIVTSFICSLYFFSHGDYLFTAFASVFIGALIPFFFCNVFSKKYKMFIGDSGSLMLGTIAYIFVCRILETPMLFYFDKYKIAMTIAIFAIPVTDTLRVMIMRIISRKSPFMADRTHLHHLLLDLGIPHVCVSFVELLMSAIIFVCGWLLTALCNLNITLQFFLTITIALLISWGTYGCLTYIRIHKLPQWGKISYYAIHKMRKLIKFRQKVRKYIDQKYF